MAHWPTRTFDESPNGTVGSSRSAVIFTTARSVSGSRPITWPMYLLLSESRTSTSLASATTWLRSEEHTSELQSRSDLVCRLLLEKKNSENSQSAAYGPL